MGGPVHRLPATMRSGKGQIYMACLYMARIGFGLGLAKFKLRGRGVVGASRGGRVSLSPPFDTPPSLSWHVCFSTLF